jgi:polyisoprenoid-binding protein YceI
MQYVLISFIIFTSLSLTGQSQKTYQLNPTKSILEWRGTYTFYFGGHEGNVSFKKGELHTTNNNITGGFFEIDMNTITNSDIETPESNESLVDHLKNEDFFDVKKYPTAKLKMTKVIYSENVNEHKIFADLTIKGITQAIEFNAFADEVKKQLKTKFKIDRTLWGITYNNRLKNEALSDAIEFDVLLQF